MVGMMRRQMRRRTIVGAAMTASMVSGARKNRAERKAIENMNDQQMASDDTVTAGPADDTTAQLEELADLLKRGIITEEEFAAKKKQILGI